MNRITVPSHDTAPEASRPLLDIQGHTVEGRPLWEVSRLSSVNRTVERVLA